MFVSCMQRRYLGGGWALALWICNPILERRREVPTISEDGPCAKSECLSE